MTFERTNIDGVYMITPRVFEDNRGWFMETYKLPAFEAQGIHFSPVQENHSFSLPKGTLRGFHLQVGEFSQAKLVRCVKGSVRDVAVDLRPDSPTYKQWVSVELSANNKRQLFIPKGFAHAFLTLEDNTEFVYLVDAVYSPGHERSILWSDPEIGVDWGTAAPIMAAKDLAAPTLAESPYHFGDIPL